MLTKLKLLTLLIVALLLGSNTVQADEIFECKGDPRGSKNSYFGTAQLNLVSELFDENTAMAILAEFGPSTYRANGTIGSLFDCHMVKVGGEFLGQKIRYNFTTGNERRWVHQYAVGGRYQYEYGCDLIESFFVSAQGAHAPSETLSEGICTIGGVDYLFARRLAGSTYYNVEAGAELAPWDCASFIVGVGYNNIRYDKEFEHDNKNCHGLSVDVELIQRFCECYVLDLKGEYRRPYKYAEAALDWQYDTTYGILTMGVFGGYVWGKTNLPNVMTAGFEFGFNFGSCHTCKPTNVCGQPVCCNPSDSERLRAWVCTPAVYMPLVLVVAEETNVSCANPAILDQITNQTACKHSTFTLDASLYFTGASLTFSMVTTDLSNGHIQASIDPATGVITATDLDLTNSLDRMEFIVTASNNCSTVSLPTFTLSYVVCPSTCVAPTEIDEIPTQVFCKGTNLFTLNTSLYVAGSPSTYAIKTSSLPSGVVVNIDAATGVITASDTSGSGPTIIDTVTITVTAINDCGSVQLTPFDLNFVSCPSAPPVPVI